MLFDFEFSYGKIGSVSSRIQLISQRLWQTKLSNIGILTSFRLKRLNAQGMALFVQQTNADFGKIIDQTQFKLVAFSIACVSLYICTQQILHPLNSFASGLWHTKYY